MAKCGLICEVYTRVVGYFRPLKCWNKGKREEQRLRTPYRTPNVKDMPDVRRREKGPKQ